MNLESSFQSIGHVGTHWIRTGLEMGLIGAVRLVTLAMIGGMVLVVVPGIFVEGIGGVVRTLKLRNNSALKDE